MLFYWNPRTHKKASTPTSSCMISHHLQTQIQKKILRRQTTYGHCVIVCERARVYCVCVCPSGCCMSCRLIKWDNIHYCISKNITNSRSEAHGRLFQPAPPSKWDTSSRARQKRLWLRLQNISWILWIVWNYTKVYTRREDVLCLTEDRWGLELASCVRIVSRTSPLVLSGEWNLPAP